MARPRAKPTDVATPERLMEAALVEFARAGFDGARLEDIAKRAGIRRPSLLYHFSTKEALYQAVVRRAFEQIGAALLGALASAEPFGDRIAEAARRFGEYLRENPPLAQVILRELVDRRGPIEDVLASVVVPTFDLIDDFVRREGKGVLRKGLPVRPALMMICSDILVRAVAGTIGDPFWGRTDQSGALARIVLLDEPRRSG
jgi:AcrR family transcriptional regulator